MKIRLIFGWVFAVLLIAGAGVLTAQNMAPNSIATKPVFVPDMTHQNNHLTALAWDATMKTTNVPADSANAHLVFYFTNIDQDVDKTLTTNVTTTVYSVTPASLVSPREQKAEAPTRLVTTTNLVWVTNSVKQLPVVISEVHPSCGCTTAQLPPLPWTVAPGTNGQIGVTVNLAGKFGTVIKTVHVASNEGRIDLIVQINIQPPEIKNLTQAELMRQMAIAKVDRQAVFKNDCATCHAKEGQYKYGRDLYAADCGICHEAEHRATMVPDLHDLKVSTNEEFWRTWIAHGKPGTFMPAFSAGDGGPLNDMQIASLAAYLTAAIPSKVPQHQLQ
jgi:mono/diheme cytochrome c family protein